MGHTSSENPVAVNVTAMAGIVMCLVVFLMGSSHLRQLEASLDIWLPRDCPSFLHGCPMLEEIRLFMRWDPASQASIRRVGYRGAVASDEDLMRIILAITSDYKRAGKTSFPILIDAQEDVPWQVVVHVIDLCRRENLQRIEFAAPMETPSKWLTH